MSIISYGERGSRKEHECNGFAQIERTITWHELAKEHNVRLPKQPHRIPKGIIYYYQTESDMGEIGTFRSCLRCHMIIKEHNLFEEEGDV